MTTPFLSIIIPAYNEEGRLPRTLERVFAFLEKQPYASEIIVVENGSSDRTLEVAGEFSKRHTNMQVIREEKRGKGNAVRRGILLRLLYTLHEHFEKEEQFLFPICERTLGDQKLTELGADWAKRRGLM